MSCRKYSASVVNWQTQRNNVVEASTLGWTPGSTLPSFMLESPRTGKKLLFFCHQALKKDGDLIGWKYLCDDSPLVVTVLNT